MYYVHTGQFIKQANHITYIHYYIIPTWNIFRLIMPSTAFELKLNREQVDSVIICQVTRIRPDEKKIKKIHMHKNIFDYNM